MVSYLRLFFFLIFCFWAETGFSQEKKVVFIILDGIPATELEEARTPNLDQIAKEGGYARGYTGGEKGGVSQTPTISAVGYNSLLTGTWANKHNVWDNDIDAPNYNYWTIFRLLKEMRPETKMGIFSTWEDNRTKLLGENFPETEGLTLDFVFDGFEKDTITYPHDQDKDYIQKIDNIVSYEAAHILRNEAPDLSWVYLEFTDDMGHRYGKSPQLTKAIELADQQVGRIWESIQYRQNNFGEDWLIWVTTDHGRLAPDFKDHGGQSESERQIWMVTNSKSLSLRFFSGNAAMVDILPTIVDFLNLDVPESQSSNWDGKSLLKKN